MPTLHPDTHPMTVDDLLELEGELRARQGWEKVKPVLSFQQEFFGFMGTAVLLPTKPGQQWSLPFFPLICTNIPNCEKEAEDDFETEEDEEVENDEESDDEDDGFEEEDEGDDREPPPEEDADEFVAFTRAMIQNLAPCFKHEKQPRFFANFNDLTEFVAPDLIARFQGYKLGIIPIRKMGAKDVSALIMLYGYEESQYLTEDDMEPLSRVWGVLAHSLKLV